MEKSKVDQPTIVDADGHILEPPDLWEKYLEAKYKPRAIRIKRDSEGWEYAEIDGKPATCIDKYNLPRLSSMGRFVQEMRARRKQWIANGKQGPTPFIPVTKDETYMKSAGHGTMFPKERLERMDQEGLAKSVLYPTLGLAWEGDVRHDPEITTAYCRAYNRWMGDFCRDSGGRLVPIAHVSLLDPQGAARELERAVKEDGCKGAFIASFTADRKPHGHPDHDPLFAAAQDLDVPVAVHPSIEPQDITIHTRYEPIKGPARLWYGDMHVNQGPMMAFSTMFAYGVFEKFPKMRFVVLESGAGWIGWYLDRADAIYEGTLFGGGVPLSEKPSYYFKRQCFISGDPDEKCLRHVMPYVGIDKFFWASDFPHVDHPPNYMEEVHELVEGMPDDMARGILGDNVIKAYQLN
jgi:predicted TIM-barrel fold metal-dependent hydrolase